VPKNLSPKQFFLLLYLLTGVGILIPFLLMNLDVVRLFYGLPFFLLPFPIIIATFFIVVAIPRARTALSRIEIPRKYSPKHFLLLLWLSGQAFLLGVALHAAIYALAIVAFGWGFWGQGDEPVFFIIALIVVPAGLVAGAFGRLWDWCVTQPVEQMKAKGIQLPTTWGYFAPFASYGWLWKGEYGRPGFLLPSFSLAFLAWLLSGTD
jgi:hypothetical protein